ncbi:MAG: hypothetical protein CL840_18025 [Crocinitomicaceae bacterium]|nr:hypothetical protein [Crocinitomicaceae bacterium]|tara:strand:- start:31278 stop:31934 length:657 start_codon:yes stop_codon:yes gene_type:complete
MTKFLKKEVLNLIILIAPMVYLALVYDRLPVKLPIHWNLQGEVDGYGPKYLMALINIGVYVLLLILPKIDPRKKNYDIFSTTYSKLRLMFVLFFSAITCVIITDSLGFDINMDRVIYIGVILLLMAFGNYMGTIKPNWFIGIRVPWTIESESVWKKTHRLAGRIWFWLGFVLLILSFFLSKPMLSQALLVAVAIMVIVPITYSYLTFQKENHSKTSNS